MRLKATVNEAKGMAQLDALRDRIRDVAIPRAINALAEQAEVAGIREASDLYSIPVRTLRQYETRKSATADDPKAEITLKGKGFPLRDFKPVATSKGVSVVIKGRRIVVPHSFLIAKFGSHVFARGSYKGTRGIKPTGETSGAFVYGKGRLPISKLFTVGPADAFSNEKVTAAMNDRMDEQAPKILARELAAVKRGF